MDLLLTMVDDWLLACDNRKHTVTVFLDLSKAFDNVSHESLLVTLQRAGIGGKVLLLLHNHLSDRWQ